MKSLIYDRFGVLEGYLVQEDYHVKVQSNFGPKFTKINLIAECLTGGNINLEATV